MHRPASRLGMPTLSVLSIALTVGSLAVVPATAEVAPAAIASAPTTSAESTGGTATAPTVRRAGSAAARAAAQVDLPRPLRGVRAVRALGDQLDEAAALNDLTEAGLTALLTGDPTAWIDQDGYVFYKDEPAIAPANDPVSAQAPLGQTFLLHSKPGSTRTIFLDFDGATAGATAWHDNSPGTPTTQPAWDPAGNGPTFTDTELTSIQTIWQAVAEDYAPFDVDVTTTDPGAAGIFRSSAADLTFGSHVLITPSDAAHDAICNPLNNGSGCGGVAYLDVFTAVNGNGWGAGSNGYGYMQPAWVFPQKLGNSPKNVAEAVSHEVGHNFGLDHDGNPTQGYDRGHGAWAPIMGVGYDRAISQWSKGDYAGANNQQDDVAIIRAATGSRSDEAPTSIVGAPAVPSGTAYVASRTDVDTFLLGTCSGPTSITARSLGAYADLDVKLSLLDAAGQVVTSNDTPSTQASTTTANGMDAAITSSLTAGTYYASIDGVGNGAWSTGYDDYGSMGAYTLAATGCDGAAPTGTPSAPTVAAATAHATDPSVTLAWAAPSNAGASAVTGYVLTRAGDDLPVLVGPTTTSYAWTGLASSTAYSFTVTALNAKGPGPSATAGATTASGTVRATAPQGLTASWDSLNQRALFFYSAPASTGSYPVTAYEIYLDGASLGRTGGTGVGISPLAPGTHTLGVAAVTQAGTGALATASVVVPSRAGNDAFAARSALSGLSGSTTGDNTESSAETGEPTPPALRLDAGAASVWYSWTAPGSGPATLSTTSAVTGRDTTLAVYTGTSVGALTQVAGNDDNGTNGLSAVSFTATAGTTYAVAVNGYRTIATGVGAFGLTWSGTAPVASATTTTLGSVVTGRSATLTANVTATSGTPAGTVEFRDNGVIVGTKPLVSGSASLTLTDLVKGDHPLRATFVPTTSTQFTTSQSALVTSSVAATSSTTTLTATGGVQKVDLTAGVTVASGTAVGTVQFKEGSATVGTAAVTGGSASLALTAVAAGPHTYTAVFVPGDSGRYDGSASPDRTVSVTDPVVAKPTSTTLATTTSGRAATLTATVTAVSGTPQGTVQLRDGASVIGTVPLAGGTASFQMTDLLRGTHRFTAEFVPADSSAFVSSQSAESVVEIAATPTSTSLSASATAARAVTLQATVTSGVAGTVQFTERATVLGTVAVSGGSASLTVTDVPAGTHTWTATFTPADDLRWAPSSGQRVADVAATPTSTALGSSISFHQVTLTATVSSVAGAPAGTVEFREGSTLVATRPVSSGTATAVLADVSTGSHGWTATFVPASPTSYAGSTSAVHTATVQATPTTTTLLATASGRTVTLTAAPSTSNGTLTGDVVFREGSTVVGTAPAGPASSVLTLTSVAPGNHSYIATFVPSGTTHAGSVSPTRSVTVQVGSTTGLTATASGREVTLAVQVSTDGGAPAGSVELREGSTLVGTVPLSGGNAALTLGLVAPGDHAYQATFVPSDTSSYVGSASPVRTVTVARVATTTDLTTSSSGRSVTLSATTSSASGTPAGSVELREGSTLLGTVALSAGGATLTLPGVDPGDHTYTATYVPTGSFHAGSVSPARTQAVGRVATATALTADVSGRTVTLTATPSTDSGTLTGSVELREGTTLLDTVALSSGKAVLALSGVTPGSHDYRATFVPTGTVHAGSTSPVAAAVVDLVTTTTTLTATTAGDEVDLDAAVTGVGGTPTGSVQVREGTTLLATVPLDGAGHASLHLDGVLGGSQTYSATFVPTGSFFAASTGDRTVTLAPTTTTVTLAPVVDGRRVVLSSTVGSAVGQPGGTVSFFDGDVALGTVAVGAGSASRTLTGVATGSHDYRAVFTPTLTDRYAGSSSGTRTTVVTRSSTTTQLGATVTGDQVSFDVIVSSPDGTPDGTVTITEGGTAVTSATVTAGRATFTHAPVANGSHTYTAVFAWTGTGDQFAPSTSQPTTVQVAVVAPAAPTTTTLTATAVRRTVTLDATVATAAGTPGGSVQLLQDGVVVDTVPLVAGRATATRTAVAAGQHQFTAAYVPGDPAAFEPSTSQPSAVDVQRTVTTTALTGSASGSTVTLAVVVTGTDGILPTGTADVLAGATTVGTVQLVNGRGTLVLPDVAAGTRTYRASYAPSPDLAGSTSPTLDVTVAEPVVTPPPTTTPPPVVTPPVVPDPVVTPPAPPSTSVAASATTLKAPKKARAGTRPTVTVTVKRGAAAAAGKVAVTVGKKTTTLTLTAGAARLKLPKLKKGRVTVTVRYLGDPTTSTSSATRTIKVT